MKYILFIITLGLVGPLSADEKKVYTATDYYRAGEVALKEGDAELAETRYRQALQLNPNHGNSRARLASMKDLKPAARIRARQNQLKSIRLPNIAFDNETLADSLTALDLMVQEASEDTFIPNFVIVDPNKKISNASVSLRLRNIPASEVLKYVLTQAKATAKWDENGITIRPADTTPPVVAQKEEKAPEPKTKDPFAK